mmetsp:Transcript_44136/g.116669  ORF Transcript_44136/g.116669 Transcript_44136/m.116669 type:complete len:638 (-) Transcript_44136:59-1972(-)
MKPQPLLLLAACLRLAAADLPVHCLLQDVAGEWNFHVGPAVPTRAPDGGPAVIPTCGHHIPNNVLGMLAINRQSAVPGAEVVKVSLTEDVRAEPQRRLRAVGGKGGQEEGAWTMMFDEGFEVKGIENRSFFSHFFFERRSSSRRSPDNGDRWDTIAEYKGRRLDQIKLPPKGDLYTCYCNQTSTGWWHRHTSSGELESGCFWAEKVQTPGTAPPVANLVHVVRKEERQSSPKKGAAGVSLADVRAHSQTSVREMWELESSMQVTEKEVFRATPAAYNASAAPTALATKEARTSALRLKPNTQTSNSALPKSWDWRTELAGMWADGRDGLSSQFDQGNCGSCYAFSGSQVLQMRFRIQLLRQHGVMYPLELSWKSATRCNPYTEGCEGGFAYLTFKYAAEVGLPVADCDQDQRPETLDNSCDWGCYNPKHNIFYAKDYGQTGGFSNGASEAAIMREIHQRGPVIISFSTTAAPEFIYNNGRSYKKGTDVMTIFKNDKIPTESFSSNPEILPWRYTTHSILCVGWGEEVAATGEVVKYWIVRNSWGTDWGTNGYAKMRRGHNDAALETSAPWVEPDMSRLPAGLLERARRHQTEQEALRVQQAAQQGNGTAKAQARTAAQPGGGRPAYCKLRPDSPDCK